jgi:phosphoglycerate dehydrogenase-like enzyme
MNCVIMSALGENSFTEGQVMALKDRLDVDFITVMKPVDEDEFISLSEKAEILAVTRRSIRDFNRRMIDALPRLRSLAIYSTGYEWVDTEYLREKGVSMSYLPEYCTVSVAEHTLAMILTMTRRTHLSYDMVRALIPEDTSLRGFELRGKLVGIIGLGRIGSEIARLLKALRAKVFYYDIRPIQDPVAEYRPMEKLVEQSDILVLACSKKRNEAPVIGAREIARIQSHALLVNPARSDLVDTRAIVRALKEKRLTGYAVDDNLGDISEGLDYGRILQTGHTAWYSTEAIERGTDQWVKNILEMAGVETGSRKNILLSPTGSGSGEWTGP